MSESTTASVQIHNRDRTAWIEVVPGRGGIIKRWVVAQQDLLYMDEARFADPALSIRGGIPILFPICGNLPGNTYTVHQQTYSLKQHGFARDLPWSVLAQTDTSLVLGLVSSDETRAIYPFDFELQLTYQLQGRQLQIQQQLTNPGHTAMPFSIGFHPYFQVTDKSALTFEIPAAQLLDHQTQERSPYPGHLNLEVPELDVALFPVSGQRAAMRDRQSGRAIELTYSPDFTTVVVWTVEGKPYVCLEPWTAQRNALNTGVDLLTVPPGQTWNGSIMLQMTSG